MTRIREVLDAKPDQLPKRLREGLKPIADLGKQLEKAMRPQFEMQKLIQSIRVPAFEVPKFELAVARILERQTQFVSTIAKLQLGSVAVAAQKLAQFDRNNRALDEAGWLPHYSTPFEFIDECDGDIDALRERISQHYRDQWSDVRLHIEHKFNCYSIDDEAKATFREALDAHDARFYRSVCRLLLPEIERVARVELHESRMERISSQPRLQELAGELTLSSIEPRGLRGLNLLRRLTEHLYVDVKNDADRQRFVRDPVPNRHATVHGLVTYSTMQHSLNAIFMADYIFQVISIVKKNSRQMET